MHKGRPHRGGGVGPIRTGADREGRGVRGHVDVRNAAENGPKTGQNGLKRPKIARETAENERKFGRKSVVFANHAHFAR